MCTLWSIASIYVVVSFDVLFISIAADIDEVIYISIAGVIYEYEPLLLT